ncbi:portal protein [Rhizorhabdus histidinilytica]|uniref:portal protein n=1 Tax=Rhizorhabdus histidinilytica TaxID=439228 RepID=UPI00321FD331
MVSSPSVSTVQQNAKGDSPKVVHERAMSRFNDLVPPQLLMRAQSLAARRFVSIPGAMWEGWFGNYWGESIKLEIPLVKRGLQKIERDYRANRLTVNFRAASGDASPETATTLDGIYRADNYHFKAQQARDNAFCEALRGGFGAYRLVNEWADPYDKDSDAQRINPAMTIVDADQSVFFDGNSKLYDKSDAMFAFVLTAMSPQAYHAKFGEDKSSTWDNDLVKPYYDWYTPTIIRVCEYYEVEDQDDTLLIFTQALSGEEERWFKDQIDDQDIADKQALGWSMRKRTVKRRRVHKWVMSGNEILEDQGFIAGSCIPIVPVYGTREYVDNMERFTGYVQDRMDSQRNYNARVSKLAETDALAPREVPIFAAQQVPPHIAEQWALQNIERHPYAVVEPLIDPTSGQIVSAGPIGKVEPPQLPPVTAALLQEARAVLQEDDQDGADEVKANTSAEAMDLAATRIDAKSGIYIDNMRQSVQREGEIYLSMCADVYFEPGREVDVIDEEDQDGTATLMDEKVENGVWKVHNDFAKGRYKVISDVTEATSTRRDKTVRAALNGAEVAAKLGDQQAGQVCLAVAFMNMDGEGMDVMQKFGRQQLVNAGLVEPNEQEIAEAQAAAAQQQPDPLVVAQVEALGAQASKDKTASIKNLADAEKTQADAGYAKAGTVLRLAQATELGAPASEPEVPSGLQSAQALLNMSKTAAEIEKLRRPEPAKTAA